MAKSQAELVAAAVAAALAGAGADSVKSSGKGKPKASNARYIPVDGAELSIDIGAPPALVAELEACKAGTGEFAGFGENQRNRMAQGISQEIAERSAPVRFCVQQYNYDHRDKDGEVDALKHVNEDRRIQVKLGESSIELKPSQIDGLRVVWTDLIQFLADQRSCGNLPARK